MNCTDLQDGCLLDKEPTTQCAQRHIRRGRSIAKIPTAKAYGILVSRRSRISINDNISQKSFLLQDLFASLASIVVHYFQTEKSVVF